jgi:hypothetical protein
MSSNIFELQMPEDGVYSRHMSLMPVPVAARSKAALVGLIPTGGMDVCCVLSGIGLSDELITRPEGSYRLWRVVVCDHETS